MDFAVAMADPGILVPGSGIQPFEFYDYYKLLRHSGNKTDSHLQADWMTVNVSTSNKAAVIIETRRSGGIVPLVLHFSAVLGPDWPTHPLLFYAINEQDESLRNRKTTLRVLSEFEWAAKPEPYPEDQWFFSRMKDLQEKDSEEGIDYRLEIKIPTF
ncbi:hypothetical protein M7I_6559 [Glarea lozoyensis 74030]|uniref:Uncharacterized protein n=1 Tax=Glarea lozoyensis (strain ATCC 74030 / MF5533) TaxID=1104152 RepID=H0EUW9_GLAL7|nr:hypothetical protein M7I_6559 [Glarea lozoyensis 74030]